MKKLSNAFSSHFINTVIFVIVTDLSGCTLTADKQSFRDNPEIRYCEERRVYYVRAEIACTPQSLFRAAWKDNQLWNKQVLEMRVSNGSVL